MFIIALCEAYLTEHSRATSQLYVGRGKRKAGEEVQVKVKRALTDSVRQLRLQSDFKHACCQATTGTSRCSRACRHP